ncbi:hypothetical protein K8R04_01610 [Candidatus Uhrbacteria bacterium]|nr:hypothetical protein [Candidatus Uhrbacteria bacterium]
MKEKFGGRMEAPMKTREVPKHSEMFLDERLYAPEVEAVRHAGEKREHKSVMAAINKYLKTPEGKMIHELLPASELNTRVTHKNRQKELPTDSITEIRGFEELGLPREPLETYFTKGFPRFMTAERVIESIRFTTDHRSVRDEDHMKSGTEVAAAYLIGAGAKSAKITIYGSMLDRHGRPEVCELFNTVIPQVLAHGIDRTPESDFDWVEAMEYRQQAIREMQLEIQLRDLHRAAGQIASPEARDLVESAIERLILSGPVIAEGMTERGAERLRPQDLPAYQELRRILEGLDGMSAFHTIDADIDAIVLQIDHYRQIARHAGPEHVEALRQAD